MQDADCTIDPFQICGTIIEGKYSVTSAIGDGGFGVVYRGEHRGFAEAIAIKCLKLGGNLGEQAREELLKQLREEGRLLHRLSRLTSGIVQALDVGAFTTPSGVWVPYLVLEWLEGQTLSEFLKARSDRGGGGMSLRDAVDFLEPAARALGVAHSQKIAHRDVKPANLFVTEVGGVRTLKVLDFGIAKVLTGHPTFTEALAATKLGPTAFTPRYGAPEQFNKQRGASGPWTDVFALALIFVELVTGRKALEGDDPTELYIAAADPMTRPTPRVRGVQIPEAVERVLERALSVEPKHRYPEAGEFWDALRAAVEESGGVIVRPGSRPSIPRKIEPDAAEAMLSTAEFAERNALNLETRGRSAMEHPALQDTLRADASEGVTSAIEKAHSGWTEVPRAPAASRASNAPRSGGSAEQSPPGKAEAKVGGFAASSPADPMAETPLPIRSGAAKMAASAGNGPSGGESKPAAQPPGDKPRSRPVWPWLLGALLIGGGALAYTILNPITPPHRPRPVAPSATSAPKQAPSSKAPRVSSAAPSASAAVPSASASAVPALASANIPAVPVPPDDMVYFPPTVVRLGDGDTAREATLTHGFFLDRTEVTVHA